MTAIVQIGANEPCPDGYQCVPFDIWDLLLTLSWVVPLGVLAIVVATFIGAALGGAM